MPITSWSNCQVMKQYVAWCQNTKFWKISVFNALTTFRFRAMFGMFWVTRIEVDCLICNQAQLSLISRLCQVFASSQDGIVTFWWMLLAYCCYCCGEKNVITCWALTTARLTSIQTLQNKLAKITLSVGFYWHSVAGTNVYDIVAFQRYPFHAVELTNM